MSEPADLVLAYERKFVPALAWSVRGAMLQFGGRMAIVEDDGQVVYKVRAGNWLIFAAILLGSLAIIVLVGPIVISILHPTLLSRQLQGGSSCVGAALLVPAIVCYLAAMASFKIILRQEGEVVARLIRGAPSLSRAVWYVQDAAEEPLGLIQAGDNGSIVITARNGSTILTVAASPIVGMQAMWRRITRGSSKARGRLRVGMGAGARIEIDDEEFDVDERLLAALLLTVAVEGK